MFDSVRFASILVAFMAPLLAIIVHLKHFVHFHHNMHTIRAQPTRELLANSLKKVSNLAKVLKTYFTKAPVSATLNTMTSPLPSPNTTPLPSPNMTSPTNPNTAAPASHTQLRVLHQLYTHSPLTKQDIATQLGLSLPTVTAALRALEHNGTVARTTPAPRPAAGAPPPTASTCADMWRSASPSDPPRSSA